MKIITIGLGYIGLPTSLMFAKHGIEVVGVDNNKNIVKLLKAGVAPIEEPHIEEYLTETLESGHFTVSESPEAGDVFIIAVPTPNNADEFGSCDLSYIKSAIEGISPYICKGNTVIIESTIAPRTMTDDIQPLFEALGFSIGEDIYLVHCPERVLPGKVFHELVHNNRIIGGITEKCTQKAVEIYKLFVQGQLIETDACTAAMSKLMENTYRDVNISLANELVQICAKLNLDALKIIDMANLHPRVNLHKPGPGVGGHCLAVDPYFIVATAPEESKLIQQARQINNQMPHFVVAHTMNILHSHKSQTVTVLGLSYKGNIDDIRESPAIEITDQLRQKPGIEVRTFDPYVPSSSAASLEEALQDSELLLVLCDHDVFKKLPIETINLMKKKVVFDTKDVVQKDGFDNYYSLGNLNTCSDK